MTISLWKIIPVTFPRLLNESKLAMREFMAPKPYPN